MWHSRNAFNIEALFLFCLYVVFKGHLTIQDATLLYTVIFQKGRIEVIVLLTFQMVSFVFIMLLYWTDAPHFIGLCIVLCFSNGL